MNILQQIAALLGGKLTKVHEKTVANKEAIESEVTRAKASEILLDTNIKNETKRAQDEEARIELKAVDLVTKEETRAKAAEKVNSDAITSLDERKVDKVEGKQLSTEDYTTAEKTKLGNIDSYVFNIAIAQNPTKFPSQSVLYLYRKAPGSGTSISESVFSFPLASDEANGLMSPAQKILLDNLLSGDSALSILGTPSQTWQLNLGSGPKIKNSGGVFELRDAADNAYADLTVNALTIKGDVTQEGGSFITQAETVSAKDNTILLNSGETGAGVTKGIAGVEIDRGTLPKYKFVFDESDDRFKVGSEGDLWSVMLRDNESDLTDKGILTWDATTKRAKTAFNIDDLSTKYLPLDGSKEMTGWLKAPAVQVLTNDLGPSDWTYIIDLRLYGQYMPGIPIIRYKDRLIELGFCLELGSGLSEGIHYCPKDGSDIRYKLWGEHNDGANSGLDADLLDGQHGSYYAKASDLNSYLPLSAGSTKPITGMLCVTGYDDSFPYNGTTTNIVAGDIQGSDSGILCINKGGVFGIGRSMQGSQNWSCFYTGTSPDDTEICATVDTKGNWNIWGNLAIDGEITKYGGSVVATKDELSSYLPLSGGTMTGTLNLNRTSNILFTNGNEVIAAIENTLSGSSIYDLSISAMQGGSKIVLTALGGLFHVGESGMDKIWTGGNDGAGSGLDADLLDGKQGSEYALKSEIGSPSTLTTPVTTEDLAVPANAETTGVFKVTTSTSEGNDGFIWANNWGGNYASQLFIDPDNNHHIAIRERDINGVWNKWERLALASELSSYLPLSAGATHKLTGELWAPVSRAGGPSNFGVNIIVGSSTVGDSGIEANAKGVSVGFGAHENGNAYFWVGGNGTQEKSYFASINKDRRGMNFLYRPMYNGTNLATVGEIPTNVMKFNGAQANVNTSRGTGSYSFTSAVPGTPNGYAYGSYLQWGNTYDLVPGIDGHWINQLAGTTEDLLYYRTITSGGGWSDWKRIAYIDEVVTLNTAQTISGAKTFTSFVTCSAGAGTSSDIRLKKYINRMFDAEELLSKLSGYRYVMKETDMHYAGLIAQEVQEVLPEAVREDKDGFLTVDTYPIVAALVEANKAKSERIEELENRLSILEEKMNIILNKL